MRIYLIIVEEPLFHPEMVKQIIESRNKEIIGITLVPDISPKKTKWKYYKEQLNFFGPKAFIFFSLKTTFAKISGNSVSRVAQMYQIPIFKAGNVNHEDHLVYLKKLKPEVIISAQGQIFKRDLLQLPKIACINRHSALLPKYGGLWPIFWAMLNKEKEIGVTVHTMEEKIDGGKILAQSKIPITKRDTLYSLYRKAFGISSEVIIDALENLKNKPVKYLSFNPKQASYLSNPKKEDIRLFNKKHLKMI